MEEALHRILQYDLKTIDPNQIKTDIVALGKVGIVLYKIPKGRKIFRARKHDSNFTIENEGQISYRTDLSGISIGRANAAKQNIFYGAIASQEIDQGYVIAAIETSNNYRTNIDGSETMTIGMWEVISDFEVVAIVFDPKYSEKLRVAKEMNNDHLKFISDAFSKQSEMHKSLAKYLGGQFSEKVLVGEEYKYKFTSEYSSLLFQLNVLGIAYPSVPMDYQGFNVALTPNTVDKHLLFESVLLVQLVKSGTKYYLHQYKMSDDITSNPISYIKLNPKYSIYRPFTI